MTAIHERGRGIVRIFDERLPGSLNRTEFIGQFVHPNLQRRHLRSQIGLSGGSRLAFRDPDEFFGFVDTMVSNGLLN
jgi:hypothetical protein